MEEKVRQVVFLPDADSAIENIGTYIAEKGYPDTAEKYVEQMIDFANSLSILSQRYPVCRHEYLALHNFRCAVFDKKYIFIYKVSYTRLIIHTIIHGSRLQ
jgi:plasmid stabilization system protein ParE